MLLKKFKVQFDSNERLKDKPTRKMRNFANRRKVVEYVIALLIEKLSLSWFLHFLTNPYNTGKCHSWR